MCSFAALAKFVSVFLTGFAVDTSPTKDLGAGIVREARQHWRSPAPFVRHEPERGECRPAP